MTALTTHLESRLGPIRHGWSRDPRGVDLPFQVVELGDGGKLPGSTSFSTLGLSDHQLRARDGKPIRQELIMTVHAVQAPAKLPQALQLLGKRLIESHSAILRGETFALPGGVALESTLSHVYAALPGYFDSSFDVATLENGQDVAIAWMIPISEAESRYVQESGWVSFEQMLVDLDPDLLNIFRDSIV